VQKRARIAAMLPVVELAAIRTLPLLCPGLLPLVLVTLGGEILDAGRGPTERMFC
jgi:hypothetical protein